jgi:hypothetical protein
MRLVDIGTLTVLGVLGCSGSSEGTYASVNVSLTDAGAGGGSGPSKTEVDAFPADGPRVVDVGNPPAAPDAGGPRTDVDAGDSFLPCPQTPPVSGTVCGGLGQDCYYEDCQGQGRTIARCIPDVAGALHVRGKFDLSTTPCSPSPCPGSDLTDGPITCEVGQVCLVSESGISWGQCVANTCGAGPLSGDCLSPPRSQCTVGGTAAGILVECVVCATPPCG